MERDYMEHLQGARVRAWNEAKELLDLAASEKRELSAEEEAKYQRINEDIDAKDAQIRELIEREERDRENDEARAQWANIVRPEFSDAHDKRASEDFTAFLRGDGRRSFDIDLTGVAAERRAVRAGATGTEFRDLLEVTAAAGGATVPTTFVRELYDFLETFSGMRRTNATILTTASGENLTLPKVVAHGTAAVVGEGSAIAEADPAFGTATLGAYKYAQMVQLSTELLTDSGVDIQSFVAQDCGRAIGRVTDTAYVSGSGSNAPTGIVTAAGTGVTAQTGATGLPSYANLVDLVYSVNEEYRADGAQWVMKDSSAGALRKLTDTTNRPLWEPSLQVGTPDRLLGFPVVTDPNFAAFSTAASTAKPILFGSLRPFYIRDVGSVRLERSDDYAFANDLVTWRCIFRTSSVLVDLTGCAKLLIDPTT